MQVIMNYICADGPVGSVRDSANAKGASIPLLVRGVETKLIFRLFAHMNDTAPVPIESFANVATWFCVLDRDFNSSTTPILAADHGNIVVRSVTEGEGTDEEITYTEFEIPIPDTNTAELIAWLGTERSKQGLTLELTGYDTTGSDIYVLQVDGFGVRNRVFHEGEPTQVEVEYLTAQQVRALIAAGLEVDEKVEDNIIYYRFRSVTSASAPWSDWVEFAGIDPDTGNWTLGGDDTGMRASGASWLSGTSNPASSLGKNGDWFFNTATCDVFQKVSGNWTQKGNIKGNTGTGVTLRGVWSDAESYAKDDLVTHYGSAYVALRSNTAAAPDTSANDWLLYVNGSVSSVNGKTGTVVLGAEDVGAAEAVHTHTVANVTGLQTALDGKQNTLTAGENITLTGSTISAASPVSSVNGQTGTVVLGAEDVHAVPTAGTTVEVVGATFTPKQNGVYYYEYEIEEGDDENHVIVDPITIIPPADGKTVEFELRLFSSMDASDVIAFSNPVTWIFGTTPREIRENETMILYCRWVDDHLEAFGPSFLYTRFLSGERNDDAFLVNDYIVAPYLESTGELWVWDDIVANVDNGEPISMIDLLERIKALEAR